MNDVHARPVEPCPLYGTPCEYVAVSNASAERIKALEECIAMLEGRMESRDWAMMGLIAAMRDELPDSAKRHNIEVALRVLKEADQ